MNEHSFIKSVHRKLPTSMVQWKIQDTFTGGVPGVMYGGPSGILFYIQIHTQAARARDYGPENVAETPTDPMVK
jgi:hypothetical protein